MTRPAALLALALLAGCADPAPAPTDTATISVRAQFVGPVYGGEAMKVSHEAIPGRMPAMTMDLRVDTPALTDTLAEGALVRLTLDSLSLVVLDVEALPSGTELRLEPGRSDGRGAMVLPDE